MEYTFECKIGILMKNLFLISVEDIFLLSMEDFPLSKGIIFDNLSIIF